MATNNSREGIGDKNLYEVAIEQGRAKTNAHLLFDQDTDPRFERDYLLQ